MREMKSHTAFIFAAGAFFFYWILALFVPVGLLREIFNSLSFGVAVMVTMTWAPAAWYSLWYGERAGEWQLIIAIFLAFFVLAFQRLYVMAATILGRPEWLVESPVSGFVPYSITVVGILFLVAPGVYRGAPRGRYWWYIIAGVSMGSLLAGILIGRTVLNPG
jgi:hypothetical protein